jgi:hypothetical protein
VVRGRFSPCGPVISILETVTGILPGRNSIADSRPVEIFEGQFGIASC